MFPSNLNVSLDFVSGNIEILGKQNSLFPSGPVIKCLLLYIELFNSFLIGRKRTVNREVKQGVYCKWRTAKMKLLPSVFSSRILGDPGAVSGDGEKSKTGEKKFGRRKVLTFLRPNFFSPVLDFSPSPLTAPGSPRMQLSVQ